MKMDIDRIVAEIAPARGPGLTPGARELLDEIKATAPPAAVPARIRRRRWGTWTPLGAALATAAVILSWLSPGAVGYRPAAALDINRQGGYYIIAVRDLYAAPQRYEAQLRQLHLDISLRVSPASPGMVGFVLPIMERDGRPVIPRVPNQPGLITTIDKPGTCARFGECTMGLKVPVGYRGKAHVVLGRKARPGEAFEFKGPLGAPGEPLHCVAYPNATVAYVLSVLRQRGVTTVRYAVSNAPGGPRFATSVPGSWYAYDGTHDAPGKATLHVGPTRRAKPVPVEGCPKGS